MSFRFMLDTDSVSFAIRGAGRVGERIVAHTPSELCISAITLAELRFGAKLAARGEAIGETDTMIAAHALTLGVTLVTNNERHFSRVPGLRTDNWL